MPEPEPLTVPSMSAGPEFVLRTWDMAVYALLNTDEPVDGRAVTAH